MTLRDVARDLSAGTLGYITHGGIRGAKKWIRNARYVDSTVR